MKEFFDLSPDLPIQLLPDQEGVGKLVDMGPTLGRQTHQELEVGIRGEPASVELCYRVGMDYVSCTLLPGQAALIAGLCRALGGRATRRNRTRVYCPGAQGVSLTWKE